MSAPKAIIPTILSGVAVMGIAIGLVALVLITQSGSGCDMYCPAVMELSVDDDVVFATTVDREVNRHTIASCDGGLTWSSDEHLCSARPASEAFIKREACSPIDAAKCFRISASSTLEESVDGGHHWMNSLLSKQLRMPTWCRELNCAPTSIAFVKAGPAYNLIVGIGEASLVVRTADGQWIQRALAEITSTK